MTIQELKDKELIILECISGSRAYGTDLATSDTDIKGVFVLPKKHFYSLDYVPQVSDERNDTVYYELGRFIELLSVNNPNLLELLNSPKETILYKHPYLEQIDRQLFLSKKCLNSFGKFALSQIKKARGLKKKIVNPVEKERKTVLDFCFVSYGNGSIPLAKFLDMNQIKQENCGLVHINHMKDIFGLYHNLNLNYKGITKSINANEVCLSSIPKGELQLALLYFNKDGYSAYCKDYKAYWSWVENRNEERYQNTKSSGKNYDAKNMMHVFRLLDMAIEIGQQKKVNVRRPNRDFLLRIRAGEFEYDELLNLANEKQLEMETAFSNSDLPNTPNLEKINQLLVHLREQFYK